MVTQKQIVRLKASVGHQIKMDADDVLQDGSVWHVRDTVFSAVCTLESKQWLPGQRPPHSEPPSSTCSSQARACCRLPSLTLP